MNYNPFDLVPLLVNGKPITGRPFVFDSDVVDQKKMTNAFGKLVKPAKVMTICPDCSQGLEVTLELGEPPFEPFAHSCPYCKPAPPPLVDPFVNPVKTGRVPPQELDPILHDPNKPLLSGEGTVADRFVVPVLEAVVVTEPQPAPAPAPRPPKKNKKKKKGPPQPQVTAPTQEVKAEPVELPQSEDDPFTLTKTDPVRAVTIEKADGLTEEQDFDDSDMVDT